MFASEEAAFDILLAQEDLDAQQACALALDKPSAKMKAKKKIAFFMSQSEWVEKLRKIWCPIILWFAGAARKFYKIIQRATCRIEV